MSYYVTEGSALNREAVARGTSVYVTDRVVPMLPERLSNGICSLNPNVDRLTQSAIMEITPKGKVVNHKICQSVIKTTFRMTYSDVNEMLAGNPEKIEQFKPIMDSVSAMAELHKILEDMRERVVLLTLIHLKLVSWLMIRGCQLILWCVNVGRLSE